MKTLILILILFVLSTSFALAHSGNTDSYGCHYCTSFTPYGSLYQWEGQLYEYYHCHNNSSTSTSGGSNIQDSLNSIIMHDNYVESPKVIPSASQPIVTLRPLPTFAPTQTISFPTLAMPEEITDTPTQVYYKKQIIISVKPPSPTPTLTLTPTPSPTSKQEKVEVMSTNTNSLLGDMLAIIFFLIFFRILIKNITHSK